MDTMMAEAEEQINPGLQDFFIPGEQIKDAKQAIKERTSAWLHTLLEYGQEYKDEIQHTPSTRIKPSNKSALCIVFSDTHFGKHTKVFDLETAKERMLSVPDILKSRELPEIDEIHLLLVGDMVEGEDIYPTQNSHIECPAISQVEACVETVWATIVKLKTLFNVPVHVNTVPGNHGRVSHSANEKTNWDNVVYYALKLLAVMANDPLIKVNCNFEAFKSFKVKDKVGKLYHHGVKHTGTPATKLKIAGWNDKEHFDFLVHGHWHEWHIGNWLGKFVVGNGCLCGPDDLAERMAVEDNARQAYFLVTPNQPLWGFSFIEWNDEE
jgi:predicted phosphodiesterase